MKYLNCILWKTLNPSTLIWMGFLGVCFEVVGKQNYIPPTPTVYKFKTR